MTQPSSRSSPSSPTASTARSPVEEFRVKTVGIFGFDGETLLWERVYADPAQIFPLLEGV